MKRALTIKRTMGKPKNPNPKARPFLNKPNMTNKLPNRKGRCGNSRPGSSKMVRQPEDRLQNEIDVSPKYDRRNVNVRHEHQEMSETADEAELVAIDFDINGRTISAKMSQGMVQLLNEDEILREQIVEKLMTESAANPGRQIIITQPSISSFQELPTLDMTEPGTSNNREANAVKGQGSNQPMKMVRTAPPVGNRTIAPLMKEPDLPDEIYSMWREETVLTLLEVYESTKKQLHKKKYTTTHFWRTICKNMKKKGYIRLTDKECQNKFESMETTYKEEVEQGLTEETSTWEYFNTMAYLQNENFQTPSLLPVAIPSKPVVDPTQSSMYESDGASSSGSQSSDEDVLNNMNFDNQMNQQPNKKRKMIPPEETSGVELLRRTYLEVETQKLKEMKAMRKIHKQQNRLQAERNILLSSVVDLLRKNSVIVRRR